MTDQTTQTDLDQAADFALASWQAQAAPLANYAAQATAMLEETQRALGALWEKAELESDEQSKQMISDSWQRAQALHNQITQMDAGLAGAGATIQTLDEQRRAALAELKSIIDAIEFGDEDHPQLASFAQEIRDDAYEIASEEIETYADEYALDTLYNQVYETLQLYFGFSYGHTRKVVDAITGDEELTPRQQAIFREFVESLDEDDPE